jgi:hypothetical protein
MIKPATFWALLKKADPMTIGRIGVALAGREDELDEPLTSAEQALVAVIQQDGDWMDERAEEKRERWRQRQHDKRERDKEKSRNVTVTKCDSQESPNVTVPSIHPSFHKKEDEDGDITRTREGRFSTPTMETVLAFAADDTRHACGKIDEQWAREWYTLMAETDPPWCDLHGRTIVSWQRRLISDWRLERRRREGGTGGKGGKPSTTGGVRRDINAPYQEPGLAEEIMNAGTRRLEGRFRG